MPYANGERHECEMVAAEAIGRFRHTPHAVYVAIMPWTYGIWLMAYAIDLDGAETALHFFESGEACDGEPGSKL
jgi:hypothetical protein